MKAGLARLVWGLLFLIHVIPLCTVSVRLVTQPSLAAVGSLVILLSILTLSALKTADVPCLRLRLSGKGWCAFILVGLLIHGDVVARTLPDYVVLETTITVVVTLTFVSRRLLKHLSSTCTHLRSQASHLREYLLLGALVPATSELVFVASPRRGPPRS